MDNDGGLDLVLDRGIAVEKMERGVKKCGFAGADIAGEKNQALAVENAASDTAECFVRVARAMNIARVRREAERVLAQSEEIFVDDRSARHRVNSKRHPSAKHERRTHSIRHTLIGIARRGTAAVVSGELQLPETQAGTPTHRYRD